MTLVIDPTIIIGKSLQRIPLADSAPIWRVVVKYGRNYTPLTDDRFAGAVDSDTRARLKIEWKTVVAEDVLLKDVYLDATSIEVETCLIDSADALAKAQRLLTLYGRRRDGYRVKVPLDYGDEADLGSIVKLVAPRFSLHSGLPFRVIGRVDDYVGKTIELDLWG